MIQHRNMLSERSKSNYKYKRRSTKIIQKSIIDYCYKYTCNNIRVLQISRSFLPSLQTICNPDASISTKRNNHQISCRLLSPSSNTAESSIKSSIVDCYLFKFMKLLAILLNQMYVYWICKGSKGKYAYSRSAILSVTVASLLIFDVLVVRTNGKFIYNFLPYSKRFFLIIFKIVIKKHLKKYNRKMELILITSKHISF